LFPLEDPGLRFFDFREQSGLGADRASSETLLTGIDHGKLARSDAGIALIELHFHPAVIDCRARDAGRDEAGCRIFRRPVCR